jgi:methionyl-tRNA formyltransferase
MTRIAFIGSKRLGFRALQEMYRLAPDDLCGCVTLADTTDTRGVPDDFESFCRQSGKRLCVASRASELASAIVDLAPDLCMVLGWYWMIDPHLLQIPRLGWFGIHGSLLPQYRGGSPLVWAIINGDRANGLSLFQLDEEMDTGDIVAQKRFPIGPNETIGDVLSKVEELSLDLIRENYLAIVCGAAPRGRQDHARATYAAPRKPRDGRIDWSAANVRIHNFVRAQSHPYPGAFTNSFKGETIRVWKTQVFPFPCYGSPGRVVLKRDACVVVACGEGGIEVHTVQVDGNEELPAPAVLHAGMTLGRGG